jgi:hypothetical protein
MISRGPGQSAAAGLKIIYNNQIIPHKMFTKFMLNDDYKNYLSLYYRHKAPQTKNSNHQPVPEVSDLSGIKSDHTRASLGNPDMVT